MLFNLISERAFFLSANLIMNEGVFEVPTTTYSVAWAPSFLLKILSKSPLKSSWILTRWLVFTPLV